MNTLRNLALKPTEALMWTFDKIRQHPGNTLGVLATGAVATAAVLNPEGALNVVGHFVPDGLITPEVGTGDVMNNIPGLYGSTE